MSNILKWHASFNRTDIIVFFCLPQMLDSTFNSTLDVYFEDNF